MDPSSLPVEKKALFCPTLEDVAKVLSISLKKTFNDVCIEIVNCPDLTQEPFTLASKGLGGSPSLVEVGGPPYLLPLCNREKVYDMKTISDIVQIEPCFIIGAGAGPWVYAQKNCEMMANVSFLKNDVNNRTYIAKLEENEKDIHLEILPKTETRCCLLANLFCCEGKPCKVLKVNCKKRIGPDNFITSIRLSLKEEFKENPVGLGGTFLIKSGKAKHHIMPDFSTKALTSDDDVNDWLKFFEFSAPLVAVGTLVSCDVPGLDLRVQHYHSFSSHGEGGHYHYDTTPDEVEYLGYFNIADVIYRIDKPENTHQVGRD